MSKLIRLGWSQLKTYLTTVLTDYKAVAKDVVVELEEKPWKFVLGGITYACNPTYQDFLSTVTQCRLQLLQLADLMRNERSQAHVDKLSILFNQQAIHAVNCIFFTVLLEKESLDGCDLYSVQNSLDKWTKWQDRIVDIGAFDRWFLLSKSMQNYDRREKSNKNCVWFGAQNSQSNGKMRKYCCSSSNNNSNNNSNKKNNNDNNINCEISKSCFRQCCDPLVDKIW
ncbi:Uncharacterized protein T05_14938 [Trichinella murrelli]|uniref:Uncharacterized protein n=1 Tax=Trichinella murrelli TaxID=144512 RepID=A0A0V0TL19_9BILA|nr:Uncharacterized protein T05_14938 [Trichinella murrelli]